jgi:hypothetical protein
MTEYKVTDLFVGTVPGEEYGYKRNLRVTISVELAHTGQQTETTEHGHVSNPLRFSISGGVWNPNRTDYVSAGQITDVLTSLGTFAPGFDADKAARLAGLWQRWHLNDVRAGCAHQAVVWEDGRPSLDLTLPCPVTGYRYGSAWLTEELPEGFADELWSLLPPVED